MSDDPTGFGGVPRPAMPRPATPQVGDTLPAPVTPANAVTVKFAVHADDHAEVMRLIDEKAKTYFGETRYTLAVEVREVVGGWRADASATPFGARPYTPTKAPSYR